MAPCPACGSYNMKPQMPIKIDLAGNETPQQLVGKWASATKAGATPLEHCDCLNDCGDDRRVAAGMVRKCDHYDGLCREEERSRAMEQLAHELRGTEAQELLGNGLAAVIRNYPEQAAACRRLLSLVSGRMPPRG